MTFIALGADTSEFPDAEDTEGELTDDQKQKFAVYAVIIAMAGPFCWSVKAYHQRVTEEFYSFKISDLVIDG